MNKAIQAAIVFTSLIVGIIIGSFVKNIPYFTWATEIQVDEVANAFLAIVLAVVIPFWITKLLDDNKSIKQFLINEVSVLSSDLSDIKGRIDQSFRCGTLTMDDKKEINFSFENLDRRLNSIALQVETTYKKQSKTDITDLKASNNEYWRSITSGEFMELDKISQPFWKNSLDAYFKFESEIKKFAHKINKY